MSLLREDAVLQSRVDSVVRAVEQVRLRLREHPDERQACSEEILAAGEPDLRSPGNAKAADRPHQHDRAGVGAG